MVAPSWRRFKTRPAASSTVKTLIADGFYINSKLPDTIE